MDTITSREDRAALPPPSGESAVTTNRWLPSGHPSESQEIAKPLVGSTSAVATRPPSTWRLTDDNPGSTLPRTSTIPRTADPYGGVRIAAPRTWNPGSQRSCVRAPVDPETVSSTDRSSVRSEERRVGKEWSE